MQEPATLDEFPVKSYDKLRYADMDGQGHVNNAVFSTFLETGRVELLYEAGLLRFGGDNSYVIAALNLRFLAEITWPGRVDVGTGLLHIGNSSLKIFQKIFQHGQCVAAAETVIVQLSNGTGRSQPWDEPARQALAGLLLPAAAG